MIINCSAPIVIYTGKHNIHFDPYESNQHKALVNMIIEAKITDLLSAFSKKTCTVRETGFSMTRPCGTKRTTEN